MQLVKMSNLKLASIVLFIFPHAGFANLKCDQLFTDSKTILIQQVQQVYQDSQKSYNNALRESQDRVSLIQKARVDYQRNFEIEAKKLQEAKQALVDAANKKQLQREDLAQKSQQLSGQLMFLQNRLDYLSSQLSLFARVTGIGFTKSGRVQVAKTKFLKKRMELRNQEVQNINKKLLRMDENYEFIPFSNTASIAKVEDSISRLEQDHQQFAETKVEELADRAAEAIMKLAENDKELASKEIKKLIETWVENQLEAYKKLTELRSWLANTVCKNNSCFSNLSIVMRDIRDAQDAISAAQSAEASDAFAGAFTESAAIKSLAAINSNLQRSAVNTWVQRVNSRLQSVQKSAIDYKNAMELASQNIQLNAIQRLEADNMALEYLDLAFDLSPLQNSLTNSMFAFANISSLANVSSQLLSVGKQVSNFGQALKEQNYQLTQLIAKADSDMLDIINKALEETMNRISTEP